MRRRGPKKLSPRELENWRKCAHEMCDVCGGRWPGLTDSHREAVGPDKNGDFIHVFADLPRAPERCRASSVWLLLHVDSRRHP